ncbi:hypothetical protein Taro_002576 [Colocasia esculenta]|uniref:Retrotransposon gag domain-containing protein n=1 Tax=Colocasia esculenta TaxID=4460 RepID=A0A843TP52_COLES|nr:hypothetical protein [Colocasia esculenta]
MDAMIRKAEGRLLGDDDLDFHSPFTAEILETWVSPKLPLPSIAPYDGTTDPTDHVHGFESHMVFHGASDAAKCRSFPTTLKEAARALFEALPAGSISSFHQLKKSFRDHFLAGRSQSRTAASLLSVRQKKDEALWDCIQRFRTEALRIPRLDVTLATSVLIQGTRDGFLQRTLGVQQPLTLTELLSTAQLGLGAAAATASAGSHSSRSPARRLADAGKEEAGRRAAPQEWICRFRVFFRLGNEGEGDGGSRLWIGGSGLRQGRLPPLPLSEVFNPCPRSAAVSPPGSTTTGRAGCNLLSQTATFLNGLFYWTWRDALESLKSLKDEAGALKDWAGGGPCLGGRAGKWTSVYCKDGKVIKLNLEYKSLSGTLDLDALADLTALHSVSFMNNHLEGSLPNVHSLSRLQRLYLAHNKFSRTIADDSFSGMGTLRAVHLEDNAFTVGAGAKADRAEPSRERAHRHPAGLRPGG